MTGLLVSRQNERAASVHVLPDWPAMDSENGRKVHSTGASPMEMLDRGTAAILAEEIELRALGESRALSLTAEQWTAFAGLTLCHQAIRHAYEADVAVVMQAENGWQRMEIPAYPEAGSALRAQFYASLLTELGGPIAEEIVRKLSPELESRFAGFGAAVQILEFSQAGAGGAENGTVTRTTLYADGAVDDETLRGRQETFFPAMEDPDGLQWGPLLARLEKAQGRKARG